MVNVCMDNQRKYKGFGELYKEASKGSLKYNVIVCGSLFSFLGALRVGYGGVVLLLILTYYIWSVEREVRSHYKTGELPQSWKMGGLLNGERFTVAFVRVALVLAITLWLLTFEAVITGTFPWSGH